MIAEYREAHLMKKLIAGLIDAAIVLGILLLLLKGVAMPANLNPVLLLLAGLGLYRFLLISLLNGTVGMKLFRIIFLSGEMEPLSFKEKFLAAFFILYRGVDYYERAKLV